MNHRYRSDAVAPDGTPEPAFAIDAELFHQPTTWPGAHLPHVWLEKDHKQRSSLDVAGKGRFTLITSIGGEGWIEAAKRASADTGVEIATVTIGPGCDAEDPFGEWAKAREIADDGCLLVRPDTYIGFRAHSASPTAGADLAAALNSILGK